MTERGEAHGNDDEGKGSGGNDVDKNRRWNISRSCINTLRPKEEKNDATEKHGSEVQPVPDKEGPSALVKVRGEEWPPPRKTVAVSHGKTCQM